MKKAFTMMELIFVLVVMGIIAAVVLPNTRTNPVSEAAVALASQIRYTQHLAMINDKYDATDDNWFRNRWQIAFSGSNNHLYSIVSDDGATFAKDPQDTTQDINATTLKGGVTISLTGGCNGETIISFDHLGRPLKGSLATTTIPYTAAGSAGELITANCVINITDGSETAFIDVTPETGYVRVRF
jgi:prepilin-type N-terminal cleavage/methylation domain-containing protein